MNKAVTIILAIALAILAQAILSDQLLVGLALFVLSAGLLILAFESPTPLARLRKLVRVNAGIVATVVLLAVSMLSYAGDANSALGLYAFLVAVVIFIVTQYWNDRTARGARLQREGWRLRWIANSAPAGEKTDTVIELRPARMTRLEILVLAAIMLLGLFLRVYQINQFPSGLSEDEARPALEALRMLANPNYRPVFIPVLHNADPDVYVLAILFDFFGTSVQVLKLWPLVAGLGGIVAFYFFCRDHLNRYVALVGAFLIATSRWHIHFSRLAEGPILVPLFTTLTALFLLRGLETRRRMDFVWAGAALAAGMYSYIAFYLFPLAVVLYLLYKAVTERDFVNTHAANLVRFTVTALLILSPLLVYAIAHPDLFIFRSEQVYLGNNLGNTGFLTQLGDNVSKALLMFNYHGAEWPEHNLPGEPMFDPASGILLVLGLGYALWNWRKPLYLLLLAWFGAGLLTSVLTYENPHATRSIAVMPAAFFFVVIILDRLWSEAKPVLRSRLMRPITVGIIAGLLVYIGLYNFTTYFVRMQSDPTVWSAFEPEINNAGYRIAALRGQYVFFLSSRFYYSPIVEFLTYRPGDDLGHPFYNLFEEPATVPLRQQFSRNVAFIFDHADTQTQAAIDLYYPNGSLSEFDGRDQQPLTEYYLVPHAQIAAVEGLIAQYTPLDGSAPTSTRHESSLAFDWSKNQPPVASPFRAEWKGWLIVPQASDYTFELNASSPMTVTLDDQVRLHGTASQWTMSSSPGVHTIRAEYVGNASGSVSLSWSTPDSAPESIPSSAFLAMEPPAHGLAGYYYHNENWENTPQRRIDPSINFDWGDFASESPLPDAFSVQWYGEIDINQPGQYSFGLASDDGSWLYIDDRLLIDNGGQHTVQQVNKFITLGAGRHKIRVKYFNSDGSKSIQLLWMPPAGDAYVPVPSAVLYPKE